MFAQKPKSIIIQALRIVLVLCAFIFGSQLLFFAFQGGILLTAFWFSIEYFAHNDGAIFCWALQILLLVSLAKEFIANNKTKKGKRKKKEGKTREGRKKDRPGQTVWPSGLRRLT